MQYKNSKLVQTKEFVKKILKSVAFGRLIYPLFQKPYLWYAKPMKRRRLQNHGVAVLERFENFMRREGIAHCMEFGTLLGFVRDHGFIKHDDDVDVVIMPGEIEPVALLKKFMDAGYGFIHGFNYEGKLIEFTIADPSQVTIDIFMPVRNAENPEYFDYTIPFWDAKVSYPNEKANNVRCTTYLGDKDIHDIELLGLKLPVAGNAEAVLESEYGSWKLPDPNYKPEDHIKVKILPGFAYRLTKEEALLM